MTHAQNKMLADANRVKAECFKAASNPTSHSVHEARIAESNFFKRYGRDAKEIATLTYNEWIKKSECRAV